MFQAIRPIYVVVFSVMAFLLNGCFLHPVSGPGYAVSIKVTDVVGLKSNDIKFIEDIVASEGFTGKRVTPSDKWECIHFIKDSPQVQVGYCYDRAQTSTDAIQSIKNFRLSVSNDWKDQEPTLKQEIDKLGDVFYRELAAKFGKENVEIESRRTGPPF